MDARWADLPKVTQEISAYLPDTQVIEKITKAQARANMRMEAAKLAEQTLKQEKIHQQHLGNRCRTLAASIISASIVAGGIWMAFLSLINVRNRRLVSCLQLGLDPVRLLNCFSSNRSSLDF